MVDGVHLAELSAGLVEGGEQVPGGDGGQADRVHGHHGKVLVHGQRGKVCGVLEMFWTNKDITFLTYSNLGTFWTIKDFLHF